MKNTNSKAEAAPEKVGGMTEAQATEWVYDQDDSQPIDTDELSEAFVALYHREPTDDDSQWSLCCAATPNCGTRPEDESAPALLAERDALKELLTCTQRTAIEVAEDRDRLKTALIGVLALIDGGWLVRDTTDDAKPGFAMRQLEPIRRLAEARTALAEGDKQP